MVGTAAIVDVGVGCSGWLPNVSDVTAGGWVTDNGRAVTNALVMGVGDVSGMEGLFKLTARHDDKRKASKSPTAKYLTTILYVV